MTDIKDTKSSKTCLRPLRGRWRPCRILALWPVLDGDAAAVRAVVVHATVLECLPGRAPEAINKFQIRPGSIDKALAEMALYRGALHVWLPGGWEHFVATGLAELVDRGALAYRYVQLDDKRLLLTGLFRGRAITVASLCNWTGADWSAWRTKVKERGERLFLLMISEMIQLCRDMRLGCLPPSAAAAGLAAWRSWLGPRLQVGRVPNGAANVDKEPVFDTAVAPLPHRPLAARAAERHVCYGLAWRCLRRGKVEGPIYVVDTAAAYLTWLLSMPVPVCFSHVLHDPPISQLAKDMTEATGLALVLVDSPDVPYPYRRQNQTLWATGKFWTWLAGTELAAAACDGHLSACHVAWLWRGCWISRRIAEAALSISGVLSERELHLQRAAWKAIYAHLVGRFAARRRIWTDCPPDHAHGRWAAWLQADKRTGRITPHRSIAGRTQRLEIGEDARDTVPLVFGCVTAVGRRSMHELAHIVDKDDLYMVDADALWVSQQGWQALQRFVSSKGMPPDSLRTKEILDRAWFTGKRATLVEKNGQRYVRIPGIPSDVVVSGRDTIDLERIETWHAQPSPSAERGTKRRTVPLSVAGIIRDYSHPAYILPMSEKIIDPVLNESLLEPLRVWKGVEDAEE